MDKKNVTPMPIAFKTYEYNAHGTGYVPCEVSSRWLQFSETFNEKLRLVTVDVMTRDEYDNPKKLCSLCLNIDDLKNELDKIQSSDN